MLFFITGKNQKRLRKKSLKYLYKFFSEISNNFQTVGENNALENRKFASFLPPSK